MRTFSNMREAVSEVQRTLKEMGQTVGTTRQLRPFSMILEKPTSYDLLYEMVKEGVDVRDKLHPILRNGILRNVNDGMNIGNNIIDVPLLVSNMPTDLERKVIIKRCFWVTNGKLHGFLTLNLCNFNHQMVLSLAMTIHFMHLLTNFMQLKPGNLTVSTPCLVEEEENLKEVF